MSIDYSNIREDDGHEFGDEEVTNPVIKVIGVGGGGGNVINRMLEDNIAGVEFIVANTDAKDLKKSKASVKIPLGRHLTRGLGAGMKPAVGMKAAEESKNEIRDAIEDADMLFIACGMGGGTGTGAAPIIAQEAMANKILTVAVVTTPFDFEGRKRMHLAEEGIEELKKYVDTIMIIPNQKLFDIQNQQQKQGGQNMKLNEAFEMTDNILKHAIGGLTDLINETGDINLDFADVKTVMEKKGKALISSGRSTDTRNRGREAALQAINSPLLAHNHISKATGVIIHILGDQNLTLKEVQDACGIIEEAANNADVIFGVTHDDNIKDNGMLVTIIATGFDNYHELGSKSKTLSFQDQFQQYEGQGDKKVSEIRDNTSERPEPPQSAEEAEAVTGEEYILGANEEVISPEKVKVVERAPHVPEHFNNKKHKPDDYDVPAFIRRRPVE